MSRFAMFPERFWMSLPAKQRVYGYLAQRAMNDTATWHQSATEIGEAIDLEADTVHRATRQLVADGLVATFHTFRSDGYNGHLILVVIDRLPDDMTACRAAELHAKCHGQRLAPDDLGGAKAPDETSGAAPDDLGGAKNKTDMNKTDINKTDTFPERASQRTTTADLIREQCPGMSHGQSHGLAKLVEYESGDKDEALVFIKMIADAYAAGDNPMGSLHVGLFDAWAIATSEPNQEAWLWN